MPTTPPTILDQIAAEKTKLSERLARLDAGRAQVASELTELEAAERVLARFSKTPLPRRPELAAAGKAKAPAKSAQREPSAASLAERVLALAAGKTRRELYLACPKDRPNVIGMQCSAISVPVGSRSVTASCMRLRRRRSSHTRQTELGLKKVSADQSERTKVKSSCSTASSRRLCNRRRSGLTKLIFSLRALPSSCSGWPPDTTHLPNGGPA